LGASGVSARGFCNGCLEALGDGARNLGNGDLGASGVVAGGFVRRWLGGFRHCGSGLRAKVA
jgi:hypothetical protein